MSNSLNLAGVYANASACLPPRTSHSRFPWYCGRSVYGCLHTCCARRQCLLCLMYTEGPQSHPYTLLTGDFWLQICRSEFASGSGALGPPISSTWLQWRMSRLLGRPAPFLHHLVLEPCRSMFNAVPREFEWKIKPVLPYMQVPRRRCCLSLIPFGCGFMN